ncbi:AAA family ATPase [Desulfuromonas sp. TF]|uniref:AAA family ATPase n=1 Tax=Desulfuromonas sp. TF TaxID=1232410 RepID=UPI000420C9B9|nr:AAA family ATPase [Desulfuromonas sp. TF]
MKVDSSLKPKRGSSRRKGDEFQDLTALKSILNYYIEGKDFKAFLEYEKTDAIDDIVIFSGNKIRAIQAKYAVDPLAVYIQNDFTEKDSRTYFGRYAAGWRKARQIHPGMDIDIELVSNRGRDSSLKGIIGAVGVFLPEFVEGRKRKEAKKFRDDLQKACAFTGTDASTQFQEFLRSFQFQLSQRSLKELREHIEGELLDHQLGITDRAVYHKLKDLVERHAIEIHDPITPSILDEIFRQAQSRFLLPQQFQVDQQRFVQLESFEVALSRLIKETESGYIVITGLPGSGKSTSLSQFFNTLEKGQQYAICRYFCFVSPNDDNARLRLEAESLRINLLSEFHNQFGHLLPRRHDYSERRFTEVLAELGQILSGDNSKLVVLLDGLDHAERDPHVKDSVLRALPTSLPPGVIVVIGTQELKSWEPLALSEGRKQRHIPIPLFSLPQTKSYLLEKHGLVLQDEAVRKIFNKSDGLPLYLRYVTIWLSAHNGDVESLDHMPEAVNGDIRDYYERLWANLERDGMALARYLSGVLAVLRFPVGEAELFEFQDEVRLLDLPATMKAVSHLLRHQAGQVSIFHDSFRVFVLAKIDAVTRRRITRTISEKLKTERGSARWFGFAFSYALDAGDEQYVLSEVNRQFVDFALQHCRPADDIFSAIDTAVKAAVRQKALIELSRLGSLHYRTHERLEHQFDHSMLAKVLLKLGRVEDVLGYCCHWHERHWLVDTDVAMQVMVWCAATSRLELGEKLFDIFCETHAHHEWEQRSDFVKLARVVAIYSKRPHKFLQWISGLKFTPDLIERKDYFAPGYAPHLAAFLESYFLYRPNSDWPRLKKISRIFPNHLVRHYILRLVARHCSQEILRTELEEYLTNTPVGENLEIAGYAVMAGLPGEQVRKLAGPVKLPPNKIIGDTRRESQEADVDAFWWSALVLGYEDDQKTINQVKHHIGNDGTMWSGFLSFMLQAGLCLGRVAAGKPDDLYIRAVSALDELALAGTEDQPQEMDTLRACRPMLPELLSRLTGCIAVVSPRDLEDWFDKLLRLRQSEIWTSHWGIGESYVDYSFELAIWERLTDIPGASVKLLPILRDCASTYTDTRSLKAGSRSDHFLWLSYIAAKSGWRADAEKWREKAIACSLTYGYRKDATLDCLIDVLDLLNEFEPALTLPRAAAILEMVKWMNAATDGRGTKHFEQSAFNVVLKRSREAAFSLIRYFREHAGRWKMLDCLEKFILSVETGDPELLWVLKDVFSPHFVERGRHPKQLERAARHLKDLGARLEPEQSEIWRVRFEAFIRTHIDPGWWPDDIWAVVQKDEKRAAYHAREPYGDDSAIPKELILNGQPIQKEELEQKLSRSVESYCRTMELLRAENGHFYEPKLVNSAFEYHASRSSSISEAHRLRTIAEADDSVKSEALLILAHRLFDYGEYDSGYETLLLAYQRDTKYYPGEEDAAPILKELCDRDQGRIADFIVQRCDEHLMKSYGGFDIPRFIARYFSACGDVASLRKVFEDYLRHCQELFEHLPQQELYGWLRDYVEGKTIEDEEIVNFLIDLLGEPEIDQAKRLLRVLTALSKSLPEIVCRICCHRLKDAEPLLRERLEILLDAVSCLAPDVIAPHLGLLVPLLQKPNFRFRMTIIDVVKRVSKSLSLPESVVEAVNEAERTYSPLIKYPYRRFLLTPPSSGFIAFLKRGALFSLLKEIQGVSDLLQVKLNIVIAYIEQGLMKQGWKLADEQDRLKDEWEGKAHGGHVIWFIPSFHTLVSELLQSFIHEALENGSYGNDVLNAIFNVVRSGDPSFVAELSRQKPLNIQALNVKNSSEWIKEIERQSPKQVDVLPPDEWTTVYEERFLTQTSDSSSKLCSELKVRTLLVSPEYSSDEDLWPDPSDWSDVIPCVHPEERLTIDAAANIISKGAIFVESDQNYPMYPFVALHVNNQGFVGYRHMPYIHPMWVGRYSLEVEGCQIKHDEQIIAYFEEWQEGYEDEAYSRDLLSAGIRLIVKTDWIRRMLKAASYSMAMWTSEKRMKRDAWTRKAPSEISEHERYSVYIPYGPAK